MFRYNDGRPSDVHVHVHCLRIEQFTCNLNKEVIAGWQCMFDQVLDQTIEKLIVKRVKDKAKGSSVGGLKGKGTCPDSEGCGFESCSVLPFFLV